MRYFAFRVVPQREFRTEQALLAAGYDAFVPTEHRWRRAGRHHKMMVTYPLLPGYLFVGLSVPQGESPTAETLSDLRTFDDLKSPLCVAGRPSSVKDKEMDELRKLSGRTVLEQQQPQMRKGGSARVTTDRKSVV